MRSMEWEKIVEKQGEEYSLELEDTRMSVRVEIIIYKEDNNRLIEAKERIENFQEKKVKVYIMRSMSTTSSSIYYYMMDSSWFICC